MSSIQKSKFKHFGARTSGKKQGIDIPMKGFLCSCNNREKDCIREAYNLLNKYADLLDSPQKSEDPVSLSSEAVIEDELKNELASLKSSTKAVKRFQVVESGAKNVLFISTVIDDPVRLATSIVSDIAETKVQQTRFLIRLLPIEVTCKAYTKDIESAFKPLAEKYFREPKTFSVVYNHRNNNSLSKDEVIKNIAEIVSSVCPENKVDLTGAEMSVIVEVIKGVVLLSVAPNFIKYKKYNLLALTEQVLVDKPSLETCESPTSSIKSEEMKIAESSVEPGVELRTE